MELLIVRHAVACERSAQRWPDDAARPLSPRGALRARHAAAGVRRIVSRPARVLTSPMKRAWQTAEILARYAGWPRAAPCQELLPGVPAAALLAVLARSSERRVAVVGHEPDLSRLLASCLPGNPGSAGFALKKMGMALVAFRSNPRAGSGELVWLLPPRTLRALR